MERNVPWYSTEKVTMSEREGGEGGRVVSEREGERVCLSEKEKKEQKKRDREKKI